MAWHRLKHNVTGETRYVASLDGEDTSVWTPLPLLEDRCPGEFDVVGEDGSITKDTTSETVATENIQLAKLTHRQRFRLAIRTAKAQLIDDLQSENIITANQANRLRNRLGVA